MCIFIQDTQTIVKFWGRPPPPSLSLSLSFLYTWKTRMAFPVDGRMCCCDQFFYKRLLKTELYKIQSNFENKFRALVLQNNRKVKKNAILVFFLPGKPGKLRLFDHD